MTAQLSKSLRFQNLLDLTALGLNWKVSCQVRDAAIQASRQRPESLWLKPGMHCKLDSENNIRVQMSKGRERLLQT